MMSDLRAVTASLKENVAYMNQKLPICESFDIVERAIVIGEKEAVFYIINGFANEESLLKIMDSIFSITKEELPKSADAFAKKCIPYMEVNLTKEFEEIVPKLLAGMTCLFVEGYEDCLVIDCRSYPMRSVEEPDKDKSLRGSRDGFVETIVFNTALIRRRLRDPHLTMEMVGIGSRSRTDVAICYLSDRVDTKLLKQVQEKLKHIQIDALKMTQQTLAECMMEKKWINPFPKFKFSERPDTAAACLLEGKIVLLVDNSPSAMILPTSVFDIIEEANDYYFPTLTGIYLKVTRAFIAFFTVFLTPIYLLFMQNQGWIPQTFRFVAVRDMVNIPLVWQLLLLELAIDGLRLAAMNTPNMLSTPLSVIAGLVLGEFSVQSGWFNSEIMLAMAFVAVANYTQPNFELGYALKFMRLQILILTAIFDWIGFVIGVAILIYCICTNRTLTGKKYLNIYMHSPSSKV